MLTKYLVCREFSFTLQEIFVIFQTGMPYNLLFVYKSILQVVIIFIWCFEKRLSCAEIEVYHNVRHHTFSEIYICRKFYIWLT
jgi:hypothetical protein